MKEAGLEEKWKELVREWQESGETLAAFARSRGIKDHQLWFWKDRILGTPKRGSRQFAPVGEVADKTQVDLTVSGITVKLPLTLCAEKFLTIVRCLAQ